jgi:hypothetical protein
MDLPVTGDGTAAADWGLRLGQGVYVFARPSNPAVAHNLRMGHIFSPVLSVMDQPEQAAAYLSGQLDYLPFVVNPSEFRAFSMFTLSTINDYRVEYDAELSRRALCPDRPSRLTAVYAFETWEDCLAANRSYGDDWPLSEVRLCRIAVLLRACRVNMEIVSLARLAYARSSMEAAAVESLWRAYWSSEMDFALELPTIDLMGREVVNADAIPELLIDGRLDVDNTWLPPSTS